MNIRVGFGYDVHPLGEGRELWLGGIKLEFNKGCVGHSDADVLLHAICDALLGAANLRDIGYHFPNNNPKYKGADSKLLLKEVVNLLLEKGYKVGNIDATLSLEAPKINPHIKAMQEVLAPLMNVTEDEVSIKATTNEKLGYVGREEGVNAYAVALIYKINS
ncbi:MAG: 2-C-methyl-D-erythritol 2,4-cyclodiphosphate synthase [Bacteroidetes bacterium]|jgi:2-C-methyl-D-erythritol 2,4-cyclodiphosphate synthase|nr:2-C-methyl-D-erythritol 2,4-cyclodiphosphate synthase [Bacteroidota bacterium]MCA6443647.1 2-C-methyl-D-erythritol 2,4-cyclodiphosphate synthase [Bacteroidota bacterium]